jgi:hypothetical protein
LYNYYKRIRRPIDIKEKLETHKENLINMTNNFIEEIKKENNLE